MGDGISMELRRKMPAAYLFYPVCSLCDDRSSCNLISGSASFFGGDPSGLDRSGKLCRRDACRARRADPVCREGDRRSDSRNVPVRGV